MIWPFVIVALAVSIYAFRQPMPRAARPAVLAAIIYLPFAMYLGANPGTRWLGPAVWIAYVAAAALLHFGRRWLAVVLSAPAFVLAGYVAYLAVVSNLARG